MPRDSREGRGGFIFIPERDYSISFKVLVTDESVSPAVETDVTNYVMNFNVDWPLGQLAAAHIGLSNKNGHFLDTFNGGEKIEIWAEYGDTATPTNKIFNGKIDNVFFSFGGDGYKCNFDCRQAPELMDTKVVMSFVNKLGDDAVKEVIDTYFSGLITYTNTQATTERITASYRHVPAMQVLQDIAIRCGMDIYIDTILDVNMFEKESIENDTESVSYQTNLFSLPRYGKDNTRIFNRVTVYGKELDNVIIIKTEQDEDSQTDLWRKDLVITDNSLTTMEEVQDKADVELTNNTNIEEDGRISTLAMPQVVPGDMITVLVPFCGLSGKHKVQRITWSLGMNGFLSDLEIKDNQAKMSDLFRDRINVEEQLKPYNNLNEMTDSFTVFFNESPAKVSLGGDTNEFKINDYNQLVLQPSTNGITGVATFDTVTTDTDILSCEFRMKSSGVISGEDVTIFEVSNNGGITWDVINPGVLHTFASSGTQLKLRITISNIYTGATPEVILSTYTPIIDSIALLYKVAED